MEPMCGDSNCKDEHCRVALAFAEVMAVQVKHCWPLASGAQGLNLLPVVQMDRI